MFFIMLLTCLFLIFLLVGMPVAFALGIPLVVYLVINWGSIPVAFMANSMVSHLISFTLLALPAFLLSGKMMNTCGVTERLFDFAIAVVGRLRGGLAHANCLASMLFASMSGTAVGDAGGLGAIEIDMMNKAGYHTDFAAGVRNALRRKPNIILVGEARDRETVSAAIEAGQTGHAVYSTVHTTGVAATIRRMVSTFEPEERSERAFALMETMRLIVTQALVPKVGGGRCGIREYMRFDDDTREFLLDMPPEKWTNEIQRLLPKQGQTMARSAEIAFEKGMIDRRWYLALSRGV